MKNIAIIASIYLLFSCSDKDKKTENQIESEVISNNIIIEKSKFDKLPVQTSFIKNIKMDEEIEVNGFVDVPPENIASMSFQISGNIKSIGHNVLPGKFVNKGTVLATGQSMEFLQIQEEYLQNSIKNELLVEEYNRQKSLAEGDAGAKKKYQEAENALKLNKAILAGLESRLNFIGCNISSLKKGNISKTFAIYAPFNGYIKTANVSTGKSFTPTDVLFELINKDHLHVELKVFEKDAHKVKEGQDVIFTKKDGTNSIAKIFLVGKTFEEATKTVNIHVHFEDIQLENELIVGQLIKGTILINGSKVNAINESAIKREEFGNYVFTIENENSKETRIVKHKVEIGKIQKGMVQLLNFNTNKKIVSSGINFIETIEVEEE